MDRIDLQLEVPRLDTGMFVSKEKQLSSSEMRLEVQQARTMQDRRYKEADIRFNGELSGSRLRQSCILSADAEKLLQTGFDALGLSIRAYDRVLKIARTIADLEGSDDITLAHAAEAFQYRTLDKKAGQPR